MKTGIYYIKYVKVKGGFKADGFTTVFKTLSALKSYYSRTSTMKVKFIKGY